MAKKKKYWYVTDNTGSSFFSDLFLGPHVINESTKRQIQRSGDKGVRFTPKPDKKK
jgi:hypothetical protein